MLDKKNVIVYMKVEDEQLIIEVIRGGSRGDIYK